jgi:hypothetical protein
MLIAPHFLSRKLPHTCSVHSRELAHPRGRLSVKVLYSPDYLGEANWIFPVKHRIWEASRMMDVYAKAPLPMA